MKKERGGRNTTARAGERLDALFLLFATDAEAGVRDGLEALLRDLLPAAFAKAEAAVLDPLEGLLDFAELVAFVLHQAERDVLFEAVGAEVGQVHRQRGKIAGGVRPLLARFVLERLHVSLEDALAVQEERLELEELALGESALDGD